MPTSHSTFRSILVPVDGSSLAEQAILHAVAIAQRAASKLRLALVHREVPPVGALASPQTYNTARLQMQRGEKVYLRSLAGRVRNQLGRPVSSVALSGPGPADTLARYVRDSGVDLVVMTTHGRGGVERAWMGSVADQLIRTLEVPVLVIRAAETMSAEFLTIPQILVPLDGSALAEAALAPAIAMARLWGAGLTLVRIVQPVVTSTELLLPGASSYDAELTEWEHDAARNYLERMTGLLRQDGLLVSSVCVLGGATAGTILDLLQEEPFGLLVLATHGRTGIGRLALGSVADKLVRAAGIPVLVVRPSAQATLQQLTRKGETAGESAPTAITQRPRRVPVPR